MAVIYWHLDCTISHNRVLRLGLFIFVASTGESLTTKMRSSSQVKRHNSLKLLAFLRIAAISLFAFLLCSAWQPSAQAQVSQQGQWTTLTTQSPINPIHIALMHNGKVLVVAGTGNNPFDLNPMAGVWDPVSSSFTTQPVDFDMFCNGMIVLPDGR